MVFIDVTAIEYSGLFQPVSHGRTDFVSTPFLWVMFVWICGSLIGGRYKKHPLSRCFSRGAMGHELIRFRINNYSHSTASVLSSCHFSCIQYSVSPRAECRQVTPRRVSSASGTKAGTTAKTFFQTQGGVRTNSWTVWSSQESVCTAKTQRKKPSAC